jgi:hypothetical protein
MFMGGPLLSWGFASSSPKQRMIPSEGVSVSGAPVGPRSRQTGLRFEKLVLSYEADVTVLIRCVGCAKGDPAVGRFVSRAKLVGHDIPAQATFDIKVTRHGWVGRYVVYLNAGSRPGKLKPGREQCLSVHQTPVPCPPTSLEEQKKSAKEKAEKELRAAEAKAQAQHEAKEREAKERAEREAREKAEREAKEREGKEKQEAKEHQEAEEKAERETKERKVKEQQEAKEHQEAKEKLERKEREAKEKDIITSIDNTKGDLAPYQGEFRIAYQPFVAQSDTITYAGITVGNPEVPLGVSTYKIDLRICTTRECTGTGSELGGREAEVDNYGLTSVNLGEIAVTPGQTYYLVWSPPEEVKSVKWVTFWHAGEPYVEGSGQMEAVVRGYDQAEGHPSRVRISYLGIQPPVAPYSGRFIYAFQSFKAASNEITKLGVVIGNPKLPRDKEATEKVDIRLCTTAKCTQGPLAIGEADIINYGVTEVHFPGVAVTPNDTYYVNWEAPEEYEGEPWVTFWFGKPKIEDASSTEAFAAGYDEGALTYTPTYYTETPESNAITTFSDYEDATNDGQEIMLGETVEVSCKVFAPEVESTEPEGFWYRIHSKPWNDKYYAVANAFRNITGAGEGIDTDPNVPNC